MRHRKPAETIASLASVGLVVHVSHQRRWIVGVGPDSYMEAALLTRHEASRLLPSSRRVDPHGGTTVVSIYRELERRADRPDVPNLQLVTQGCAYVSKHDNYDKKRGVLIALGRALKVGQLRHHALASTA